MGATQTYQNVTDAVFERVKQRSLADRGTVYAPTVGNTGTASTAVPVADTVVLAFDLDSMTHMLSYEITSLPFLVTEGEIWDEIAGTLQACGCKPG